MTVPIIPQPNWLHMLYHDDFLPSMHVPRVASIDPAVLELSGIRGIIFDVDNTLTLHHRKVLHPSASEAFYALSSSFRCIIFSNCGRRRHEELFKIFNIPIVPFGFRKPGKAGFEAAISRLQLPPHQIAVIGDRLLTDILGGNQSGCLTILVDRLSTDEPFLIRLVRGFERFVYFLRKKHRQFAIRKKNI